jgi:hypothetical protein
MAAGRLYRPKAKSFWTIVRRLLLHRGQRPPSARGAEQDRREEKSGLLSRSSLEQLLVTDDGDDAPAGHGDVACQCAKKHGQQMAVLLTRPEAAAAAVGGRDGASVHRRRFVFGGFRRRLLMRRPWRPVLVAIPE